MLKKIQEIDKLWWIGLFLILAMLHFNHFLDSDEGVVLAGAWDMINGKKLYYDFFEFIPPAGFYLIFWCWKIFGVSYIKAKFLSILIVFLSLIGLYKLCRRLSASYIPHLITLAYLISSVYWPVINHNTFNFLFLIWSTYFFYCGLKNFFSPYMILSGLLAGVSILFLQQKGLALSLAEITFLWLLAIIEKNMTPLKAAGIYSVFCLLPVAMLFIKWPAALLFNDLIRFPMFHYLETNRMSYFWLALSTISFGGICWLLKKEMNRTIYYLVWLQIFLLISTVARPDLYHLTLSLFPAFILLCLAMAKAINFSRLKLKIFCIMSVILLFILLYPAYVFIDDPFFFGSIAESRVFSVIKSSCQSSPFIYAGPFLPGVYFEARKINPSPFSFLITNQQTTEQFFLVSRQIRNLRPPCAVLNYELVKQFHYNKANPVDEYILNNYRKIYEKNGLAVYKLNTL